MRKAFSKKTPTVWCFLVGGGPAQSKFRVSGILRSRRVSLRAPFLAFGYALANRILDPMFLIFGFLDSFEFSQGRVRMVATPLLA